MTSESPLFHKPKSFLSARQSLYASLFVGILAVAIRAASVGVANAGGVPFIAATIVFSILVVVMARQMSLCQKWARTATLILYVLALMAYPMIMHNEVKASMLVGAMFVIQAALAIYALVLLYNKECTEWFNSLPTTAELP